MATTIEVGILGATGMVGQQFIALLAEHPWFKVTWLGASQRSAGKAFRDARRVAAADAAARRRRAAAVVEAAAPGRAPKLVFSGLDSSVAGEIEGAFAQAGHVIVSNSRNYRMDADVPLLIPEVNADHLALLTAAGRRAAGRAASSPTRTASSSSTRWRWRRCGSSGSKTSMVTTLQAISGAGYPGVPSWDILGNVIPFIGGGEEEKIETETQKILGALGERRRRSASGRRSAPPTTRVPVQNGHTGVDRGALEQKPTPSAIIDAWNGVPRRAAGARAAVGAAAADRLPRPSANRPQPALDANRDGGMTVTVGRLRPCPVLDYKFVALGHNTIRGAAGAAILNAELMHGEGLL